MSHSDLPAALDTVAPARFKGHLYRVMDGSHVVHNLRFEALFAGNGAGRCNPSGIPRLYMGVEKTTAQKEFRHHARKAGLDPDLAECYEFAAQAALARVVDLRDKQLRKHLGITLADILADWEPDPLLAVPPPPTRLQMIGYWVAQGSGNFSAILVPSKRFRSGSNIVIFKDRLRSGHDLVRPLTKHPAHSWP